MAPSWEQKEVSWRLKEAMTQRLICGCPLCQLDRSMISRLEQQDSVQWYANLASQTFILIWFPDVSSLISHMRARRNDAQDHQLSDMVYLALLRELSSPDDSDFLQTLLLRILIPVLHKEFRTIRLSFPQLLPEDIAQQLVTTCLETLRSHGIREKTTYVGTSIIELTRRDTIRWAIRQYRHTGLEETGIAIDETMESKSFGCSFEPEVELRHLLDKSLRSGLLSPADENLLIAYELEGLSGKELGRREGLSPGALSERVRRALDRLSRAFKKPEARVKKPGNIPPQ